MNQAKTQRRPEKVEQALIVRLLRSIGAGVYVLGTRRRLGDYQGTMQTPGLPDLWVFLPARPRQTPDVAAGGLWVEVKPPGGRLSPEQRAFREACTQAGVPYLSGGLEDVIRWLITIGWLRTDQVAHYHLQRPSASGG